MGPLCGDRGGTMANAQKAVGAIVVIFALYAVINSPETSAYYVKETFEFLSSAVRAIFRFFDSVIG
jgi:hypothetical protein